MASRLLASTQSAKWSELSQSEDEIADDFCLQDGKDVECQEVAQACLTHLNGEPPLPGSQSSARLAMNAMALGAFAKRSSATFSRRLNGMAQGPSMLQEASAALFSVFLGATDGLSLGALLMPHSKDHPNADFRRLGMSLGLLTSMMANIVLALLSQMPHSVGGMILPVVPIMVPFFKRIGPTEPVTVLFAIPMFTIALSLATLVVGRIGHIGEVVKHCPFTVYGGFIAGSGAQLIEFSMHMMWTEFEALSDLASWKSLCCHEALLLTLPGICAAIICFFVPRICPKIEWTICLPATVVCLVVFTLGYLLATGTSLAEGRDIGLLFPSHLPSRPHFYEIWLKENLGQIRWDLLLSIDTLWTFTQVFIMAILTISKNIFGVAEITKSHIDVNRELQHIGIANLACGLVGGAPSTTVMCISLTAHSLGARTKTFSWCTVSFSALLFMSGDYVVALLPRSVPACLLLWLGLLLLIPFVWDMAGTFSMEEFGIIILMIFIDLTVGCGCMIVVGLFLSFLVAIRHMMHFSPIKAKYTLGTMQSDVSRSSFERHVLLDHGGSASILQLAAGYLPFWMSSDLLDEVRSRKASETEETLRFLVLDLSLVVNLGVSPLNCLKEILGMASEGQFHLILAGVQPGVLRSLKRFGIPTDCSVNDMGAESAAGKIAQEPERGRAAIVIQHADSKHHHIEALNLALEFCEEAIITSHNTTQETTNFKTCRWYKSHAAAQDQLVSEGGLSCDHSTLPALVDIHWWLTRFCSWHTVEVVTAINSCLESRTYEAGEIIYSFKPNEHPEHKIYMSCPDSPVPPLVWLIHGEVEHLWTGEHQAENHIQMGSRLEKATVHEDSTIDCIGPLQTIFSFQGGMPHPGELVACHKSHVVLLRRQRFLELKRSNPDAADLFSIYLLKKQNIDVHHYSRFPRLYHQFLRSSTLSSTTGRSSIM